MVGILIYKKFWAYNLALFYDKLLLPKLRTCSRQNTTPSLQKVSEYNTKLPLEYKST